MKLRVITLVGMLYWAGCTNAPQTNLINQDACTVAYVTGTFGDSSLIHVPNIFTPDGDGANDGFFVALNSLDPITSYELRVDKLSGANVFTTNDPNDAWNGTESNGDPARSTLYDYVIEITTLAGTDVFTGQVTLIRPGGLQFDEGPFEIQHCADCVFPDQIDPRNGAVRSTSQPLGDVCL